MHKKQDKDEKEIATKLSSVLRFGDQRQGDQKRKIN
jgi:hypothetical protein